MLGNGVKFSNRTAAVMRSTCAQAIGEGRRRVFFNAEKARMGGDAESEDLPADRVLLLRSQRRVCSGFGVYGEALARDISAKNLIYPVFYPLLLRRSAPYDSAPHGGIYAGA